MTGRIFSFAVLALLAIVWSPNIMAHSHEAPDEEKLAQFELYLGEYEAEVVAMNATVDAIVAGTQDGGVDALIEQWEAVEVHEAIEDKATIAYPGVWQALIQFRDAVAKGEGVETAGAAVKASLWQGIGALKMAASVKAETPEAAEFDEERLSGPESVAQIIADLKQSLTFYELGDGAAAEAAIHDTYENRFEYLEGDLIPVDADLVTSLEADFNATLPLIIKNGGSVDQYGKALATVIEKLGKASAILEQVEAERKTVF